MVRASSSTEQVRALEVTAEEEARQARLLLQQASRLARVGAWTVHLPTMKVEWTPEAARLLGSAPNGPIAWDQAFGGLPEPHRSELRGHISACMAHGRAFGMEARLSLENGQDRWLEIVGEPEPPSRGPCRRVIGAVKDVTEARLAARQLHELNAHLLTTFESITSGFYMLDRTWRFTYANHETERVTRRHRRQLLGQSIFELFPWFRGSRLHWEYERALHEGRAAHVEVFLDPLRVWAEVHAYPSRHGFAVYFKDITDRKLAQDALRSSEERHRLLFEVSLDALFQVEHVSGRIIAANPAACRMFRLSEAQLCDRGRDALLAPGEVRAARLLAQVEATGSGRGCLTLLRGDGTEFEAELSGALFHGADGVTHASVAVRDISDRLRQEAEIRGLNATLAQRVREKTSELEAANEELRAYAHSLAHDLRTPIAAVTALAHVLEQRLQGAAEKERAYATRLRQAAQQLDTYVGALLAHARLAQAPLTPRHVDLSMMAQGILDDLRLREPDRAVMAEVQPGLGAVGDPALLRRALENLLGNAWKFTKGRPDALIRFSALGDVDGLQAFCVCDNGAGFAMDHAHRLFGPFERLHTQAEFPGTGIGLASVKRIVLRHGGRVWATGTPGAGAAFCFALPRELPVAFANHLTETCEPGSTKDDDLPLPRNARGGPRGRAR